MTPVIGVCSGGSEWPAEGGSWRKTLDSKIVWNANVVHVERDDVHLASSRLLLVQRMREQFVSREYPVVHFHIGVCAELLVRNLIILGPAEVQMLHKFTLGRLDRAEYARLARLGLFATGGGEVTFRYMDRDT